MVVLNYTGEEINAKIVYYGPGLSGKTTNLEYLYGQMPADSKGQMVSMKTRTDRTLFFDFFPLELGEISGYRTRFLLYTVPGQVYYNATRKLVLKGADAVVFVADSAPDKLQENIESLRNLEDNLNEHGLSLDNIPWVIQYNKRDLPDCMPVSELHQHLNLMNVPAFEAIAMNGAGVYDTFKEVAGLLYHQLKARLESGDAIARQSPGADDGMPRPAGEKPEDVNTAIDSALRELGGAVPHQPAAPAPAPTRAAPAGQHAKPLQPPQPPPPQQSPKPASPASGSEQPPQPGRAPQAAPGRPPAQPVPRPPIPQAVGDSSAVPPPSRGAHEPQGTHQADDPFNFGIEESGTSPDVGRLVEFDDSPEESTPQDETQGFITDPMQRAAPDQEADFEAEQHPVVTERKLEAAEQELVVPVLVSRSQVRKTIPLKLRLEIRVVDD
jgi:signal recognition particle receptor subunit beta